MSGAVGAAASPTGAVDSVRPRRPGLTGATPSRTTGAIVLAVIAVVFLIPMLAMLLFTFQSAGTNAFTLSHWLNVVVPPAGTDYSDLTAGITNSLVICVITVAIVLLVLLPTMLITELRYPRIRRVVEFVCILPITVPTVVLVVGFVPVYQVVASVFGSVSWTLSFAIGIIVLPYAYRPIQSNIGTVDTITLSEAARSLGASWLQVVWRVLLPNLRRGILTACFLTIAVVLGEFTIANFLSQNTFQTALLLLGQSDGYVATIFALAALLFAFVLLTVIGRLGTTPRKEKP